ncbi:NEDD4-binding protein 2 [Labrus bergylta]|uniref:NEDD4-binding protein 2 n=1 Tax=Labrus bergylta TaxID=56723 RepID=UPI003313678E
MPRRKKNGQSPARVPGGPSEGGSLGHGTGSRLPQGFDGSMVNNFIPSSSLSSSGKEDIVKSMQEMFSHLDPEVIYIVLSECDFKVENAMDSLLELSVAAEVAAPIPSPVSGFELTAAALLSPRHQPTPDTYSSQRSQLISSPPFLTEELDLLVDQELETLTLQQDISAEHQSSQYLSSFPQPSFPQQDLPELLQSSLRPGSRGSSVQQQGPVGGQVESIPGASSPLDRLSTWEDKIPEEPKSMVNFTHLMTESCADASKPPLDLAASGRPSAFQVYKKQDSSPPSTNIAGAVSSNTVVGGARSKVNTFNQELFGYMPSSWNPEAPVFSPRFHENHRPTFITPVAQAPPSWPSLPRNPSPWMSQGPASQAPLKPSATIPKSWALHAASHPPAQHNRLRLEGKVLVLLRGAPGSGKSTLARALVENNPGGVTLSTDDFFTNHGRYRFDPSALGEAHEWNHKRATVAFERCINPIIIDNTNMQGWEMKPYVAQALKHGYKVLFREPDTWWKNKPRELERRSKHSVPWEKIRRMLDGYERFVSVQSIMGSQMPDCKKQRNLQENGDSQPESSEQPCPDLVGQSESTGGYKKSHPQLFSSLPDISSITRSTEVERLEDAANQSADRDDEMDLGELDSELDARLELSRPGDQSIPDCIVESVMNEDHRAEEVPVAFSESIGQRVRRERTSRRSGFDNLEPADLLKDTNQSDGEAKETEKTEEEGAERAEAKMGTQEMLNFVGDWPSEGSLQQRQVRRRERQKEGSEKDDGDVSREANKHKTRRKPGPNVAEFQKLLDLIQTGVATMQTSSCSSSVSSSSGEESAKEEEEEEEEEVVMLEESRSVRSNSEEREDNMNRVDSSRGELPDCVLDWKAADSCRIMESGLSSRAIENLLEIRGETGIVDLQLSNQTNPPSADLLLISENAEVSVSKDDKGSPNVEGDFDTEPSTSQSDRNQTYAESRTEGDGGHVSEVSLSPVCEGSVETESNPLCGGSQERKQRQGRRSGKQCKLALTFTQNCPASSPDTLEGAGSTNNNSVNILNADVEPKLDLFTLSKCEVRLQPPSPSPPAVDTGRPTQTEPQDFARLWRLNRLDSPVDAGVTLRSDITVLFGESSRFVPELSSAVSAAVAVHPSGHKEVPYHVAHEKGTQVEEKEFGAIQDRLESLRILSRHFKLVSFDTLEDLYDKCHQDLDWTTNLLLDSGERFFKDEEGEKEMEEDEEEQDPSGLCAAVGEAVETRLCDSVLDELPTEDFPAAVEKGSEQITYSAVQKSDVSSSDDNVLGFGGAAVPVPNADHSHTASERFPETERDPPRALNTGEAASDVDLQGAAWGVSFDNGVIIEESRVEIEEEIASMDEAHRLLQAELAEMEREGKQKEKNERRSHHLNIQSVELKLSTEVALQLTELFGPVGVDPGTCSSDDYAVQMDLNLAKLLHQKWKETIQEKQRQATLSFHLLQESSVHWGESQEVKPGPRDPTQQARFLISADGYTTADGQPESHIPFMDHWSVSRPHVSLREIIKEQQALQENVEKTRESRADLDRRDGATLMKENQLFSLFPTIDRHFLQDIFRNHNYSLTETELFLRSLLGEEPVKTVVAPEAPRSDHHRAASKEREKKQKPLDSAVPDYQDTEDPEYVDFRAEASLQRGRQLESFAKAAEAFKQGNKDVASFYAQQGHMHGKRMREANDRAAVQIFERVNSSLLPRNILDLHGLHVDEALEHLGQVLEDKSTECEQGLCQPQLSIITGRGNHSQGGVARIRPAVIDYLTNKHYRFTEPNTGTVLVSLK